MKTYVSKIALVLAFLMADGSVGTPRVQAMLVPSQTATQAFAADRNADMTTVRTALENKVVRERLAQLGLSPEEVNRRLGTLSDEELHRVAMHIDKENPAGDATGILVIVALVLLIIYLIKRI